MTEDGKHGVGRAAVVLDVYQDMGCDIVGLQKTRRSGQSMFVASDLEGFTASHSVAVESYLTRLLKDTSERTKIDWKTKHLPPRVRRNYTHTRLYMVGPEMLSRSCW